MTNSSSQTLDNALMSLSRDVWERLRDVKNLPAARSVRFGEETITDILMLDLNRHQSTRAIFTQTSKQLEAISGTDFELWLGSAETGWILFAIQAKKLHLQSEQYRTFRHKVNKVLQIDRLVRYAARHGAIPLYCLYNYSDSVESALHWHCCQRPYQEKELGCTVTPVSNVRTALSTYKGKNFDFLHRYKETLPWRCLAACPKIRSMLGWPLVETSTGSSHVSLPLFGVTPEVYRELPARVRDIDGETTGLRYSSIGVGRDELDPTFDDPEVGIPRRTLVVDINQRGRG